MVNDNTIKAVTDAIESAPKRKFTESVDLIVNLKNVDLSQPKNRITESIILPNGRGKATKIGVFARGDLAIKSQSGGADLIISPEDLDKMSGDKKLIRTTTKDIDFFVAEAPMMPSIGKSFGPILGPKGKMPDPIPSSADPTAIIRRLKNTVKVRTKDKPTFHTLVGNLSMSAEDIAANIEALLNTVESKLANGSQNIASVYVKTTMGPAVRLI
jgi:large subunit ribosomal protein L1